MLSKLITRSTLDDLAGGTAFLRGEEYLSVGAVGRLRATDDKITAKVEGTATYQVELWVDHGELVCDCTCPRAADRYFCKHCVAVGLAWIADHASDEDAKEKSGKSKGKTKPCDPWRDIKDFLGTQPPETLVELLLDAAQRDDRLYQLLLLKAEQNVGGCNVVKAFRRAIDEASSIHGFIDWRNVGTFAGNIDQVAESMAELLKSDTAPMLVELAEYAIERVEHALEQVVPMIVGKTKNSAYYECIELIRKVGGLMKVLNQSRQFGDYLAELRVQFKPKRNFIKLLDDLGHSTAAAK